MKKCFWVGVMSYLCSIVIVHAQDLFTQEKSLEFANYLYDNYEFKLAEPEYQRLFFYNTSDSLVASRYFLCNYKLGNYAKNKMVYSSYLKDGSTNDFVKEVYLRSLVLQRSRTLSLELKEIPTTNASFYEITGLMLCSQWDEARSLYQSSIEDAHVDQYTSILNKQAEINYKKPVLAGTMSAIVPGSGKAYCGYWTDAVFSFVFVSLSAWQAYRGFEQKGGESVYGWVYACVGTGFYIGNIFGSVKAANKRNYILNHGLHHQVQNVFVATPFE